MDLKKENNIRDTEKEQNYQEFTKFSEDYGIFVFCDIRNFSKWAKYNQQEIRLLLEKFYNFAYQYFHKNSNAQVKYIFKLIGDGFFYAYLNSKLQDNFSMRINFFDNLLNTIFKLNNDTIDAIKHIHNFDNLELAFGISFGFCYKFKYKKDDTFDCIGERVNYSSRLCSIAEGSTIYLEKDLENIITDLIKKSEKKYSYEKKQIEIKGYGKEDILKIKLNQ